MSTAFERVTHELYRRPPSEFTNLRDERAAEIRHGDPELANSIRQLRRPTTAAWAVNVLALRDPDRLGSLLSLGERLRAAHAELRGERIQRLDQQRSQLLRELTDRADELTGHALSERARTQVSQTLNAAVADSGAADRVRAGTLSKPLEYSGFGPAQMPSADPRASSTPRRSARREHEALVAARSELEAAASELGETEDALASAEADQHSAEQRQADLRRELDELDSTVRASRRQVRARREERERARQRHETARNAVLRWKTERESQ